MFFFKLESERSSDACVGRVARTFQFLKRGLFHLIYNVQLPSRCCRQSAENDSCCSPEYQSTTRTTESEPRTKEHVPLWGQKPGAEVFGDLRSDLADVNSSEGNNQTKKPKKVYSPTSTYFHVVTGLALSQRSFPPSKEDVMTFCKSSLKWIRSVSTKRAFFKTGKFTRYPPDAGVARALTFQFLKNNND